MMNKVVGYMALNNMKDRFGNEYQVGGNYHMDGDITYEHNGFRFCGNLEDVFRYCNGFDENTNICLVEGFGKVRIDNDETMEYFDLYATSDLTVLKVLEREEIINDVINKNCFSKARLIAGFKLTDEEIDYMLQNSIGEHLEPYVDYYQRGDKKAFQRRIKQ